MTGPLEQLSKLLQPGILSGHVQKGHHKDSVAQWTLTSVHCSDDRSEKGNKCDKLTGAVNGYRACHSISKSLFWNPDSYAASCALRFDIAADGKTVTVSRK